jgi:hypothetical protein
MFEHNESELELAVLWRPLGYYIATAAVLYLVFRNRPRPAYWRQLSSSPY